MDPNGQYAPRCVAAWLCGLQALQVAYLLRLSRAPLRFENCGQNSNTILCMCIYIYITYIHRKDSVWFGSVPDSWESVRFGSACYKNGLE